MGFIAEWTELLGRKGSQRRVSQHVCVSAVEVDRREGQLCPHTSESMWVWRSASDWLWMRTWPSLTSLRPVRTYTYCFLRQSIGGTSFFLESRIGQKRNEKSLALTVSAREKQSILRTGMYTGGLPVAPHLFLLLVRLVEWTQTGWVKNCLQGWDTSLVLAGLTDWKKEGLLCTAKKESSWLISVGLFLSSEQTEYWLAASWTVVLGLESG